MSRKIFTLIVAFVILISSITLFGCREEGEKPEHEHSWGSFYIAEQPTCSKEGKIEKICSVCGEKAYDTLNKLEHNYVGGVCTVCGDKDKEESVPEGTTVGIDVKYIYNKFNSFGNSVTETRFIEYLSKYSLEDLHTDLLGTLCFDVINNDKSFPLCLTGALIDFEGEFDRSNLLTVTKIVMRYEDVMSKAETIMSVVYSDGTIKDVGAMDFSSLELETDLTPSVKVSSLGVNKQNELIIFYNNQTARLAGKINKGSVIGSNLSVMFSKNSGNYVVTGVYDNNATEIIIPSTHRGQEIRLIQSDSFYCNSKIKSVVINDGINTVGDYAFGNCSNLKSVVIPSSVTNIGVRAFYNTNGGLKIFCEVASKPSGWAQSCFGEDENYEIYYKGEWAYVEGVPTPNN
jgi:hypothetical protein